MNNIIEEAAQAIQAAERIVILTGAGVSKESGVPTFRDAMEGLWAQYDPQQLATPFAFMEDPKLVWDWYEWRRELVRRAAPNPGHLAIAKLHDFKDTVHVITQNVDDLHEQANSKNIIHLHGNIARNKCFQNCQGNPTHIDVAQLQATSTPPKCPHCGAYVRPDIVWFGEALPSDAIGEAMDLSKSCDLMLVVGTSGQVRPASILPVIAAEIGAMVIEVNPDETPLTKYATHRLAGPSGELLPKLMQALEALQTHVG